MTRLVAFEYLLFLLIVFSRYCFGIGSFAITSSVKPQTYDVFRLLNHDLSCKNDIERNCNLYNGIPSLNRSRCECSCSRASPMFGFHGGKWSCSNSTEIRRQTGCTFRFQGEDLKGPIRIVTKQSQQTILLPSISCSIDYSKSRYSKCDGKWTSLNTLLRSLRPFSMFPVAEIIPGSGQTVHTMKISKADILAGRLISLRFRCTKPSKSSCALFKLSGTIKCPAVFASAPTFFDPTRPVDEPSSMTKNTSIKAISTVAMATRTRETSQEPSIHVVIVCVVFALGGIICIVAITTIVMKRKRNRTQNSNSSSNNNESVYESSYVEPSPLPQPIKPNNGLIYHYAIAEGSRRNPWAIRPNNGYEIPQEHVNSKNLHISIPQNTESGKKITQNDELDTENYLKLYNDDGSPGWK